MGSLTIGQLAKGAGVGVETLRFYEREGLIAEPERRASGYRQYPPEAVDLVRFIRHAKELGFTLKEIQELLDLYLESKIQNVTVYGGESGKERAVYTLSDFYNGADGERLFGKITDYTYEEINKDFINLKTQQK